MDTSNEEVLSGLTLSAQVEEAGSARLSSHAWGLCVCLCVAFAYSLVDAQAMHSHSLPAVIAALCLMVWAFGVTKSAQALETSAQSSFNQVKLDKREVAGCLQRLEAQLQGLERSRNPRQSEESGPEAKATAQIEPINPDDMSVGFPEDKTYPLETRRLNNFAGCTRFTFESVLERLDPIKQDIFKRFSELFDARLNEIVIDRSQFYQIPDNFTRLRFLQADDYDMDLAFKRLKVCIEWRQSFAVDRFLERPDMKLVARYRRVRVRRIVGMDKTGSPLVIERLGEFISSEESFKAGMTMDQWVMCYTWDVSELLAALRECSERTGRYHHRLNYIGDLAGSRISGTLRLIGALKVLTKVVERNFPETAGNLVLINAPTYAYSVWNMIKRFLDPKIVAKISILVGPSPSVLRKICGEAVLPREFGGTNSYIVPHPVQKCDEEFNRTYPLE